MVVTYLFAMNDKRKKIKSRLRVAIYCIFLLATALITAACEGDDLAAEVPDGRLQLHVSVNLSGMTTYTRSGQLPEEVALKSLSLFLYDMEGQLVIHENFREEISKGNLSVSLPQGAIGQEYELYLIANESVSETFVLKSDLLLKKTNRHPDNFGESGFPMTSGPIFVQVNNNNTTVKAELKRVPSALYAYVERNTDLPDIHNNSYKIEVEGLQLLEGALFEDLVAESEPQGMTDYSSNLTAINVPEKIAYFYQSKQIRIHITPQSPMQGETRMIEIDGLKTVGRNKRHVLKIIPAKAPNNPLQLDFTVEVQDWDKEDINVEIPMKPEQGSSEGLHSIIFDNLPVGSSYFTILADDESPDIYHDHGQRSFYVNEPLQVKVSNDLLHFRFYSAVSIENPITIWASMESVAEPFALSTINKMPAFADITVPFTPPVWGLYRTKSGHKITIPASDLKTSKLTFSVETNDRYWRRIEKIKAKWFIRFTSHYMDPSIPGDVWDQYWGIRPVHIREAIAFFTNVAYMIELKSFQEWQSSFQGRIVGNDGVTPVDMSTVIPALRARPGFIVGLVGYNTGVLGAAGGEEWAVSEPTFVYQYENEKSATVSFHELGHCLGYEHSSGMTHGLWAEKCCNIYYTEGTNRSDFPVPSPSILNSKANPNLYDTDVRPDNGLSERN